MKSALGVIVIFAISILGMASNLASAADYPTRTVTIINPFAPGGTLDLQSRAFAAIAEKSMGQPFVVVNKPGATGMIGGLAGAQSAPDGYTLTVGSTAMTCALEWEIASGRKPPFGRRDFITIGSFTMSPTLVVVPYDSPWKTLEDLIKDARAKPGHYAFGSGGLYGMSHIPAEIFARALGLKFRHVPFSGGGPALSAIVGKHVDFGTQFPPTSLPLMEGKKLRVLAVQSDRRLKAIPDVPTVKELGFDAEYYAWVGILAPVKTPMPIVEKLREAAMKSVKDKTFIDAVEKPGDEIRFMNGDELANFWEIESEKVGRIWAQLVKESAPK